MSIINLFNKLNNDHDLIVQKDANQSNRYRILRDYTGTYIQKYIESEEKMVDSIFRVFDAVKPERGRKLNVNPIHEFSIHNDSLFDYGSIIGYKLKKPWYLFNRLVAIHIPLCPNDCWHCFVPKELYTSFNERYKELTALQIVELFKNQRKTDRQHGKESNVLRITGGEPFLAPELLLEVLQIIQKDNELSGNVFVWTETNLEPFVGLGNNAFMDKPENMNILEELSGFSNFCVHPCFHGLSKDEFNLITGKDYSIDLDDQLDALRRLVKAGIDVYPTFGTNVCDPCNIEALYKGLKNISSNLPLKVALVKYDFDYPPVASRILTMYRRPPLFSKFAALRMWNQLLLRDFGLGYAVLPRHLVTYDSPILSIIQPELSKSITKENEIVYFFKSSYRDLYHREILDLLAFPSNHIFEITYDKNRVQDDLFFHMEKLPEQYKGKRLLWVYVDRHLDFLLPLRYGEIVEINNSDNILAVKVKLNDYLTFSNGDKELTKKIRAALSGYFGYRTVPPGGKYMLFGEDFTTTINTPGHLNSMCISSAFDLKVKPVLSGDFSGFRKVIDQLIAYQDMKQSLFYRLTLVDLEIDNKSEKDGKSLYVIKGGKSFKIIIDYYQPNYQEFDEKQPQQRTIDIESSNSNIQVLGSSKLVFSKYGSKEVLFRTEKVDHIEETTIVIHSLYDDFRAANIPLNVRLEPTHAKNALRSLVAAALLAFGTIGFSLLGEAIKAGSNIWNFFEKLPPQSLMIPNIIFFVILTLCFFFVFFFKSTGVSIEP